MNLKGFEFSVSDYKGEGLFLAPSDYSLFGMEEPQRYAPVVGIVMEVVGENYFCPWDVVQSIAHLGSRIKFLPTAEENVQEAEVLYTGGEIQTRYRMTDLRAVVIPDGKWVIPNKFFSDYKESDSQETDPQTAVALQCLMEARAHGIPVLALGRGSLLLAGFYGLTLYRDTSFIETPFKHESCWHDVILNKRMAFQRLVKKDLLNVISQHKEFIAPESLQAKKHLKIYGCSRDGMTEVFGLIGQGILGVLWDAAAMSVMGDIAQKAIIGFIK